MSFGGFETKDFNDKPSCRQTRSHYEDPPGCKTPSAILGILFKSVCFRSHSYRLLLIDSILLCQEQPVSLFQRDSMPVKPCEPPIHMFNLAFLTNPTANICRLEKSERDVQTLRQRHRRLS